MEFERRPKVGRKVEPKAKLEAKGQGGTGGGAERTLEEELLAPAHKPGYFRRHPWLKRKAIVGGADDPAEREADWAAAAVLGMSSLPAEAAPAASALPGQEDGEGLSGEPDLERGGDPLPAHLRGFFEPRFGHDLGHVRVHTGETAAQLADAVTARAFAFGSHVWLGRGEPLAPSFVVAHELAHVIQQTQTPSVQPIRRSLLRDIPYWWPKGETDGSSAHDDVVLAVAKSNKLFSEVPVPGATSRSADDPMGGYADLYKGSTTVGVRFDSRGEPEFLPKGRRPIRKNGAAWTKHNTLSAPLWKGGRVTRVDKAPKEILLGEVKPPWFSKSSLGGMYRGKVLPGAVEQLRSYKGGFEETIGKVNELDPARKDPAGKIWSASVDFLSGLQLPASVGKPKKLILVDHPGRSFENPPIETQGKLKVAASTTQMGLLHYAWIPDQEPTVRLDSKVARLPDDVKKLIMDPLFQPPPIKAGTGRVKRRKVAPRLVGRPAPLLRRMPKRVPPAKDTFDRAKWDADYRKLHGVTTSKKDDYARARQRSASIEVNEAARAEGFKAPRLAARDRAFEKGFDRVEFWLSVKAKVFATLRQHFGRIFVAVAKAIDKFRKAAERFFHPKDGAAGKFGSSGGVLRKILEVAWRLVKFAGGMLVRDVMDELWDSLARGVEAKLAAIIPSDLGEPMDKAYEYAAGIEKMIVEAADKIEEEFDLSGVMAKLEALQDIGEVISDIATIVRWAKRAIALAQCLTPPGWGCLKLLISPLTDALIGEVAETCWFQRKIVGHVAKIDLIRNFSKIIAGGIITQIQAAVPASLADFLAPPEVTWNPASFVCKHGEADEKYPDPAKHGQGMQELAELLQGLTEEEQQLLLELMEKAGIDPNNPLTEEDIERLKELLKSEECRKGTLVPYVELYPNVPEGTPALDDFVRNAPKMPPGGRLPTPEEMEGLGGETPTGEAGREGPDGEGLGGEGPDGEGLGGEGPDAGDVVGMGDQLEGDVGKGGDAEQRVGTGEYAGAGEQAGRDPQARKPKEGELPRTEGPRGAREGELGAKEGDEVFREGDRPAKEGERGARAGEPVAKEGQPVAKEGEQGIPQQERKPRKEQGEPGGTETGKPEGERPRFVDASRNKVPSDTPWESDATHFIRVLNPQWDHRADNPAPYNVTVGVIRASDGVVVGGVYNAKMFCVAELDVTRKRGEFRLRYEFAETYANLDPRVDAVFIKGSGATGIIKATRVPKRRKTWRPGR